MAELRKIKPHVALGLTEEFLSADNPVGLFRIEAERDTETVAGSLSLERFDEVVRSGMSNHARYSTSLDTSSAIALHRALPISRRDASDTRLWAWLGTIHRPEFIAWRWRPAGSGEKTGLRSSERFIGSNVRQGIARLWWAAELTVGPDDDYDLTERLLTLSGFQDGYEAMFGRAFCQYRPALAAFIDVVGSENEKIIRETSKEFGYVLTTMVLESMNEPQIAELLRELVQAVKSRSK